MGHICFYADAQATIAALQAVIDDHHRLVRELDVSMNGAEGAAKQASLCDLVSQIQALQRERDDAIKDTYMLIPESGDTPVTWEEAYNDAQTALDAEREKVKGLHEVTRVICTHCCEPMEIPSKAVLQTQLTQRTAELEAAKAELNTVRRDAGLDCGDHSCLYAMNKTGMRTNGGCRCSPKHMKNDLGRSRKACDDLHAELERVRAALEDACLSVAVHGEQPPQKWLDALRHRQGMEG